MAINISNCDGFQWDDGNIDKNWKKHGVKNIECEEVFFNQPFMVGDDHKHSIAEKRYFVLGQTDLGRKLFIAFTVRARKIRVISARNMTKNEKRKYYEKT
ncbi:MAG: BrnT family toxin [Candidatus Marinimicrobia bacterium]|nr:BrnT family toxin [Candidatus Neomarinimicrobiota bacterium]MBL7030438.1 BrnT family toxin [Candidatus Neomarinimicrobiota bacterium]